MSFMADRINSIDARGSRKVFALAAKMTNPINLSIGQPDYDVDQVVKDFKKVEEEDILSQLLPEAKLQVRVADLKALGITDYGSPGGGGLELFFMGQPMTLSRWPNEDFVRIADIVVDDGHKIHGIPGSKIGKFHYKEERPERWLNEKDPWVHGYWFWDWSEQRQPIASIDPEKKIIEVKEPYHNYGYRKGQWYYAYNLLSELDEPGEWFLDREAGKLYFWPTAWLHNGEALVSILPTMVQMDDVKHVVFNGFTLEASRSTGLLARNVSHVEISDCTVRNVGRGGISVSGSNSKVTGCTLYQLGGTGIALNGGDRKTLTPSNLLAENNHIHHYGRIKRMYTPGIAMRGVGIRAANNLIHTAPHMAIQFSGNENIIEYNEIHHVCLESNDAGAIYSGRNWTMRGNKIRYNYMHHVEGFEDRGCVGVYLDDMFSSADIVGNVFYKVYRAAFIGGGRDNNVLNNVFIDCPKALHIDARAMGWATGHADGWIKEAAESNTHLGIKFREPPYSERYPQLLTIIEDEPKAPKGNVIARNIFMGDTKWDDIQDKALPYQTLEDNWINEDPHFVDPENLNFQLKDSSPMLQRGFKKIPLDKIGLLKTEESNRDANRRRLQKSILESESGETSKLLSQLHLAKLNADRGQKDEVLNFYALTLHDSSVPAHLRQEALELRKELKGELVDRRMGSEIRPLDIGYEIFVAQDGDDANPGTIEKPYATLTRAVERIRELSSRLGIIEGDIAVNFREGVYPITGKDSTAIRGILAGEIVVVYRAYNGEAVTFYGGKHISGFAPVQDNILLSRIPQESRDKVLCTDLKAQGITEYGVLQPRGVGFSPSPAIEVYCDGKPMHIARYPNEGFLHTEDVTEPGNNAEKKGATFHCADSRISRWTEASDPWLYGYWYYEWADCTLSVASLDVDSGTIKTNETSNYKMRAGQPYYVYNLLEEIDEPGEWYLDRESGILYFYPPEGADLNSVEISMLDTPMITLKDASYVRLEGITLDMGRGNAIEMTGGSDNLIAGCTVKRFAGNGIVIKGGANHGVFGCNIHTLGRRGVELYGGDRKILAPSGHFVENCDIHHFSRIDKTYTPAVQIDGVGHRIAHNKMHHSPGHAMRLEGNDHIVEFNEIYEVVRETDDQGGLDMWYNPTYQGNLLQFNYWHDMGNGRACGQAGIRLDDAICGTVIYGNVFERCSDANFGGVQIHGGKDNWIDNNIFVDCPIAISFSPWGKKRYLETLEKDSLKERINAVDAFGELYTSRYPELLELKERVDSNRIWRNIVFNCGTFLYKDQGIQECIDNYVTANDPGFLDYDNKNFRLREGAPVLDMIGFRNIPFERIGQYEHPLRAK